MATTVGRFAACELHGLTDAELCGVLRPSDLIDKDEMYTPQALSYRLSLTLREIEEAFVQQDSGKWVIADVHDRVKGGHPKAWGYAILSWLETRPDVSARPDELILRTFRRENPELFKSAAEHGNLAARMQREAARVQHEAESANRQRKAEEERNHYDRLAEILSRFDAPQDGDIEYSLKLLTLLELNAADLVRYAKFVRKANVLQGRRADAVAALQRAEEAHAEARASFDREHGERRQKLLEAVEKARSVLAVSEERLNKELGEPWGVVTAAERAVADARRARETAEASDGEQLEALAKKAPFLFTTDADGFHRLKYPPVASV